MRFCRPARRLGNVAFVDFFCQSAKAHAVNISYIRKSELGSQHLYYAGDTTLRESQQLYYTAGITTGPLALFIFFSIFRLHTQ